MMPKITITLFILIFTLSSCNNREAEILNLNHQIKTLKEKKMKLEVLNKEFKDKNQELLDKKKSLEDNTFIN
tara:strand:+ start:219 stop:434 length:216 start_codon:yes stop_codon:yes gene_type:complete